MRLIRNIVAGLIFVSTPTLAAQAVAETDDNYPWKNGSFSDDMSLMVTRYPATWWQGPAGQGMGSISSSTDIDYRLVTCGKAPGLTGIVRDVSIGFINAKGDLDIEVYGVEGTLLGRSQGVGDSEMVNVSSAGRSAVVLKIYGYRGATNIYDFGMECVQQ